MTDKERYQELIQRVEKARNFPYNTTPASRHVAMMGRRLVEDGKSFSLDDDPQHCGESMLLTVADFWETKERAINLVWVIKRLVTTIHSAKNRKDITLLCDNAMGYIKKHGLDVDNDADSNNQAAG